MSTQLVQQTGRELEESAQSPFNGTKSAFDTGVRIAQALSQSTVIPVAYRNNVPNVLVAMELANRIGASVLAVMQNCDVIHGNPSLRAKFLIACVNASGRFSPVRYRWQGEEGTDEWGCRAVAKDESGEECIGPLITIALAKAEGWYSKKDSKWQTIPELMLMYRSAAWWSRVYCPELSLGIHTSEEVEDFGPRYQAVATELSPAAALNAKLLEAGTPDPEPSEPDDARQMMESALQEPITWIATNEPGGTPETLDAAIAHEARELVAAVFEDREAQRGALFDWLDGAPTNGQIRDLVRKVTAAGKARDEFEQPSMV